MINENLLDIIESQQKEIDALKKALEQPQPRLFLDLSNSHGNHPVEQPAWHGLTDDEINEVCLNLFDTQAMQGNIEFAKAIEQALKEKNT